MNGLMMDFQLTLPTAPAAGGDVLPATSRSSRGCPTRASTATRTATCAPALDAARRRARRSSGSSAATASRRSAGTTTSTSRRTSASRAAASSSTRSTCGCTRTTSRTSRRTPATRRSSSTAASLPLLEQFKDGRRSSTSSSSRTPTRSCSPAAEPGRVGRPRARRERGRRDVLHERHDRPAEGRRLLAPLDDPAHARRRVGAPLGIGSSRGGHVPAGRADVPRERVGLPVPRGDARREASSIPGPHLDGESLLDAFVEEKVTWTAGVPTIWLGILAAARREPRQVGPLALKGMLVGGSAAPRAMIDAYKSATGSRRPRLGDDRDVARRLGHRLARRRCASADDETQFDYIAMQGMPLPFVEIRARDGDGNEIPWDDETMGELEIRGPWVASRLLRHAGAGGAVDGRRLVQDRRHRLDPPARLHPDPGPLEGRDQVGRRVDLVGRARERAHGAPGRRRGGRDRDAGREVGRAAARGRRAQRGADGDGRRAARVPRAAVREVVAAGRGSSSSTRSRRRASASSARRSCASCSRRRRRSGRVPERPCPESPRLG